MINNLIIETISLDSCPVCHSKDIVTELVGEDFETATGSYRICLCKSCSLSFTNPRPAQKDIPRLYESRTTPDFPHSKGLSHIIRKFHLSRTIDHVLKLLKKTDLSVLDYGCGDGLFDLELSKKKPVSYITTCDFHDQPPPLIRNHGCISYVSYAEYQKDTHTYDFIFCRHVLEHVENPKQFLVDIRKKLGPHGYLFIEVPSYDSIWKTVFGKYFYGLNLPRHLYHFSKKSITIILHDFAIKKISRSHTPVLGKSISYRVRIPISNTGIFGLLLLPLQIFLDAVCNRSSGIAIIAQQLDN